jgi:hypothetical protein
MKKRSKCRLSCAALLLFSSTLIWRLSSFGRSLRLAIRLSACLFFSKKLAFPSCFVHASCILRHASFASDRTRLSRFSSFGSITFAAKPATTSAKPGNIAKPPKNIRIAPLAEVDDPKYARLLNVEGKLPSGAVGAVLVGTIIAVRISGVGSGSLIALSKAIHWPTSAWIGIAIALTSGRKAMKPGLLCSIRHQGHGFPFTC